MESTSELATQVFMKPSRGHGRAHQLLTVAWLSLVLGLGIELILLGLAAGTDGIASASPFVADLAQKITWSTIVCIGLACGAGVARARSEAMGMMGLISAPIAFVAAKAAHKGVQMALSLVGTTPSGPSPYVQAGVKTLEYAVLGWLIGRLARQAAPSLTSHMITGACIGAIFGGTMIWLTIQSAVPPLTGMGIVTRSVNELLFPIGCSIVLYFADVLGKKL